MTEPSPTIEESAATRSPQQVFATTTTVRVLPHTSPILQILERGALPILTVLVFLFFTFNPASSATFPTVANLNVILGSQAVVTLLALAAMFPLVAGYFDFSLGAVAAFSQVLTAGLMAKAGLPLWLAVLISILMGALVGAVNGFLITKLKMSPFVTTLGVALLLSGIAVWYTSGQTIATGIDPALTAFGSAKWLGLPVVVYTVLLAAIVAWYFLAHTPYGRSIYAIGSNAASARLVGIRVERNVWWTFIVGGSIAGLAGVLQLSRIGSATGGGGNELLFPALAAVFLGATTIIPGFFNVFGTIIGALFVSISVSGLTLTGAGGWAANVFNGLALLVAVGLSTFLGRRRLQG
jgi:ribose transport system permease protein